MNAKRKRENPGTTAGKIPDCSLSLPPKYVYKDTHTGDATVVKRNVAEENAGVLPQQKTTARCVVSLPAVSTPIDEREALDQHGSDLVGQHKVPACGTIGQKLVLNGRFSLDQFM